MRKTALLLALAIALPAWAQDKPADKAAEKPAPAAAQDKPKPESTKPEASARKHLARHSRRMEDARHCLDEPTNTAIIKCAEAYL